ncbi:hypothetical protein MTsPCn9_08940 [Croceitalea sp. MTPC9]|uniref:hypothetical protein n=1 Tax=unclassified Croceitalea TaxID=2632280 RepID=UPI002B3796CF|nr:hypothetical protein MTsPCn6_34050 [Croceitalea sp. MTPC6]GMN15958.1 hypothetical protein MTsPCn9_08940 [Croceitalea sp. MTPC9]
MDCLELNPANDFAKWEPSFIKELRLLEFKETLGSMLLFEDDSIKLWNLKLEKGERMPFLKHNKDYSWISETDALLKSRFGNGKIALIRVEKGDTKYHENFGKSRINDLENVGETPVIFKVLEYKDRFHDMHPMFN